MDRQTFLQLVDKYLNGTATTVERGLLEEYYKRLNERSDFELSAEEEEKLHQAILKNIRLKLTEGDDPQPAKVRRLFRRYAAAAAILVFVTAGAYFVLHKNPPIIADYMAGPRHDIAPGGNKMFLTTADGKKINLSDAKSGTVAQQGSAAISKTADGQIVYTLGEKPASPEMAVNRMNTLETPMSGQGSAVLSDGTKVWLNAGSKLVYPAVFKGKERRVELQGEAYIEVAHNAAMPFRVVTGGQTVEDIGTRFDINAYVDEPSVRTTLVEGSVRVLAQSASAVLTPGQQARIMPGTTGIKVVKVNTGVVTAWKDGFFRFDDEPLPVVMRQFARWYAIEVVYQGSTYSDQTFNVKVPRNASLQAVLKIIGQSGIRFRVEGRKLIVL